MRKMERGINQVLFYFTPRRTFDSDGIYMVDRIEGEELTGINRRLLTRYISHGISRFRFRGFPPRPDNPEGYVFLKPKRVIAFLYPPVYRCISCRRVVLVDHPDRMPGNVMKCQVCGGILRQIHHVMVCRCGNIQEMRIPECKEHGTRSIDLDDANKERYADFVWRCLECGRIVDRSLRRVCSACGSRMEPAVHRSSKAYQVHHVTLIDFPEAEPALLESPENVCLLLGALLKVFRHPEERLSDYLDMDDQLLIQVARKYPGKAEELMRIFRESSESRRQEIIQRVREIAGETLIDSIRPRTVRIYEFLRVMEDENIGVRSLRDMIEADGIQGGQARSSMEFLRKFGISDIYYTSGFPVLTAVYGYTRLWSYENEGTGEYVLTAFPPVQGKTPVYATRNLSEAIIIQLDPVSVYRWLWNNGQFRGDIPESREVCHVEILRRMESVERYSPSAGKSEFTRIVFGLQHTISHLLMRQASVLSGMERTSIGEFHFPEALSFAIYSIAAEGTPLGGFLTLIEQNLREWIRGAFDAGKYCIYDPVCRSHEASCHACTHVSEMSCQFFNDPGYLNRNLIYGSENLTGFLDVLVRRI